VKYCQLIIFFYTASKRGAREIALLHRKRGVGLQEGRRWSSSWSGLRIIVEKKDYAVELVMRQQGRWREISFQNVDQEETRNRMQLREHFVLT